jgi:two-component sensor histidine kinase
VEDNGIGLPESFSFEKIDSLGLKLVKILIDQLQGNLEVFRNGGTKFVINLK